MVFKDLEDLYVDQLRDLYDAEQQITEALPKMAGAASDQDLKEAFDTHYDQTRTHVERLEEIFSGLSAAPQGETCEAMQGLIKEGNDIINAEGNAAVRDAALITAAQSVEHYEMAGYGAARTYAKELGYDNAADLLQTTLNEEGKTDHRLTKLAEGGLLKEGINVRAER